MMKLYRNGTNIPTGRDDTYAPDEVRRKTAEEIFETAFNDDQKKALRGTVLSELEQAIETVEGEISKVEGEISKVEDFDWASLGSESYPYGWSSGYYTAEGGSPAASEYFMRSINLGSISLEGVTHIKAVPPKGYAIAVGCFKSDGTFTLFGQANSTTHPENIDKVIEADIEGYSYAGITVGRFKNTGTDTGSAHSLDSDFVNSIKFYRTYNQFAKLDSDMTATNKVVGTLVDTVDKMKSTRTMPFMFAQTGYNRSGGVLSNAYKQYYLCTSILTEHFTEVEALEGYKVTALAWNKSDGAWAGFLTGENTLTKVSSMRSFWTDKLSLTALREKYPDLVFRVEVCNNTTASGTNSNIDLAIEADNFIFYTDDRMLNYYKDEMDTTVAAVREALDEPALVFPLATDIHFLSVDTTFDNTATNIVEFCKRVKCDFVANLGDNTDGNVDKVYSSQRNSYMMDRFCEAGIPYIFSAGNHDTNYYKSSSDLFTAPQMFSIYYSNTRGVHFDTTAGESNYYIDFDELGIRLVVLDANHGVRYGFSANTATWLTNTALDTNYIVVLFEHLSSIKEQNWGKSNCANSADVTAALQAFVTGGGTLIQLCGHSHADFHFTTPWLAITSTCSKFECVDLTESGFSHLTVDIDAPERVHGTASEDAWTVFVIKPISRTMDAIRFGAGEDRSFTF